MHCNRANTDIFFLLQENNWSGDFVEVIGRVEKDFSVMEFKSTSLGSDFGKGLQGSAKGFAG